MLMALILVGHVGGAPAVAWPVEPHGVGNVVDDGFLVTWTDTDATLSTGTVTIELNAIQNMPPTFQLGTVPPGLDAGMAIVTGIREVESPNEFFWDTSGVPSGSYFVWTFADERPVDATILKVIAFARGVVTVAHPGDPVAPAIIFAKPDNPFELVEQSFDIVYEAFDPHGSGTVRIEATTSTDGTDLVTLGEGLPATATGTLTWDTTRFSEGDWTLKATIEDARGQKFSAFSRFLVRVERPVSASDAGVRGDGGQLPDTGVAVIRRSTEADCTCVVVGASSSSVGAVFFMLLAGFAFVVRMRGPRAPMIKR